MRTLTSTRRSPTFLALTLVLALCAAGSAGVLLTRPDPTPRPATRALTLCRNALGNGVVSAGLVTVDWVRGYWEGGPGSATGTQPRPNADAFAGVPKANEAAWCWTGKPGAWTFSGVDATGGNVVLATPAGDGWTSPPQGVLTAP